MAGCGPHDENLTAGINGVMRKNTPQGFTLMEMLLVTSLIAVIAIAVFGAFSNGLKVWARGVVLGHEGDMAIGVDKISEDLRSILSISSIPFKGTQMRMSFPAVVFTPADVRGSRAKEEIIDQVGAIEYRFEPGEGLIYRRQANYGQALKKQWGKDQVIAVGVEDLRFVYYFPGDKGFLRNSHVEGKIPAGVFLQVRLKSDVEGHYLNRFIAIPVGG